MILTALATNTDSSQNLATGITSTTYSAAAGRMLFVMVRLSALNGAAATFTVQIRNTSDTKTVDAAFTVAKATGTDTKADIICPVFVAETKSYGVKISSSNASDTAATVVTEWYDAAQSDVIGFGGAAGTFASGRPEVNLTHIAGSAVATGTAQLGVNVVNFGGAAGTFASGRPEVNTTHWAGTAVGSATVRADVQTIKTQTVTCSASVTVGAFVGNGTAALSVDASGRVDVIKIAGTTQTARDIGASVLLSSGTGAGQISLASGVVSANAVQISGDATAADNLETMLDGSGGQTLSLGGLNITKSMSGSAVNIVAVDGPGINIDTSGGTGGEGIKITTANASGVSIVATDVSTGVFIQSQGGVGLWVDGHGQAIYVVSGTSDALYLLAGVDGNGIYALGGSTSGSGIYAEGRGNSDQDSGIYATSFGALGSGFYAEAKQAGHGIWSESEGNGDGIHVDAEGTGRGVYITAGTTGHGLLVLGGASGGDGANFAAQGGNGDGIQASKNGTGKDVNATVARVSLVDTTTDLTNAPEGGGTTRNITDTDRQIYDVPA